MKKFLLKTTLAVSGLLISGTASAVDYLSQEGWSISGCSEELSGEGSTNGRLSCLIDDDLNTFYHSAYNNVPSTCNKSGHYHWFMIDLGSSQTFYGLDYWRRQHTQVVVNGQAYSGKIYVSENAFTAFASHEEAKIFFQNAENAAVASFSFDYSGDQNGVKSCYFDESATGRYLLVIVDSSAGGYLSGAQVKLHSNIDPAQAFTKAIENSKKIADGCQLIAEIVGVNNEFPDTSVPSDISEDNWNTKAAEANRALVSYIRAFDRKQITIQNVRRNNTPYLTAIVNGKEITLNTEVDFTPDAVWAICSVDNGFKLYNRNTGYYIGGDMAPKTDNSQAQVFYPAVNGDNFAIKKVDSNDGLNVDTRGSDLVSYDAADGGSAWIIKSEEYSYDTPEISTAETPKYYRIVSARWMYNLSSPCLGANGEMLAAGGNGEEPSRAKASIPGVYWRIESADTEGAVKLVNLLGYELTYTQTRQDSKNSSLTDNGSPLFLLEQTAEQFAGINGGYAICSESNAGNRNCLDASQDYGTVKIDWDPTSEDSGHNNNGSLWYFIKATDAEITNATATYAETVGAANEKYAYLEKTFDYDFFKEVFNVEFLTESSSAVDVKNYSVAIRNAKSDLSAKVMKKFKEDSSNTYLFKTIMPDYANKYMYQGVSSGNAVAGAHNAVNDLHSFWTFEKTESGHYKVRNAYTGKYVGIDEDNLYAFLPMDDGHSAFSVDYNVDHGGFYFVESTHNINENYAIHHANNTRIARWNAQASTSASFWYLVALENPTIEIAATEESHTFTFTGLTLNTHESAADLQITIGKYAGEEEAAAESRMVTPDDDNNYVITAADIVDGVAEVQTIREGYYEIIVPAGMFLDANGMPNDEFADTFTVNANGSTTGIEEIETGATEAQTVIYDLQGRRLSAPVKGINIINGKKVLVK